MEKYVLLLALCFVYTIKASAPQDKALVRHKRWLWGGERISHIFFIYSKLHSSCFRRYDIYFGQYISSMDTLLSRNVSFIKQKYVSKYVFF